jgi:hypothetical protein
VYQLRCIDSLDALYNLGLMYEKGYGTNKDFETSIGYYERAAKLVRYLTSLQGEVCLISNYCKIGLHKGNQEIGIVLSFWLWS